jgi:hypothetical protein
MRDRLWDRWTTFARRARRFERRELREFRAWIERTSNLVRLSALVFVPLLVATVTYLSNSLETLSFLLFPPLASGTYTLFSNPRGKYSSPVRFVAGLTAGAGCGWGALWLATTVGIAAPTTGNGVSVVAAAVAVFLAGAITWASDVEEPAAYSTALLGLLVPLETQLAFVTSVVLTSTLVAVVFWIWRTEFYEKRATILYHSTSGDDHVLVPMQGEHADATAMLGARLAAAHDAGKVVLLDVVEDEATAEAERALLDRHDDVTLAADGSSNGEGTAETDAGTDPDRTVAEMADALEDRAAEIASVVDVPCEVVVAVDRGDRGATILQAARATGCDLLAVPYRERRETLAPFVRDLFASEIDVIVHRSNEGRTDWRRTMVPVRQTSHVAHSMVEFSLRLARDVGSVSVCHCIGESGNLRRAEEMLADLVDPFRGPIETRISRSPIRAFLEDNAHHYDLVFVGASRDRSAASRLVSPPTFERLGDLDTDVAIVDRG